MSVGSIHFLNRFKEIQLFRSLLSQEQSSKVLLISGAPGMGKSALLRMYNQICDQDNLPHALVNLQDYNAIDISSILEKIVQMVGGKYFANYHNAKDRLVDAIIAQVEPGTNIDIVSRIAISDFSMERRKANRDLVTRAFFVDIREISKTQHVVIMFDNFERAPHEVQEWLSGLFLSEVASAPLGIVVITGRVVPGLTPEIPGDVLRFTLGTIDLHEWTKYALSRGLDISEEELEVLQEASNGIPLVIETMLSNLALVGGKND